MSGEYGVPFVDPPPTIVNGYPARVLGRWLRAAWERGEFRWDAGS